MNQKTFGGLTGLKIGDHQPGPVDNANSESQANAGAGATEAKNETTMADTTVGTNTGDANQTANESASTGAAETEQAEGIQLQDKAQGILDAVDAGNAIAAPVRTSIDTAEDPPSVGVVAALDRQIDADTTIVHGDKADEQMNNQQVAVDSVLTGDATIYSCHPMVNFNLGKYQFRNGQLRLESGDVDEFEELVATQPPAIRNSIKKIDVDMANRIAASVLRGRQTSGVDTTANSLDAPNTRPFNQ